MAQVWRPAPGGGANGREVLQDLLFWVETTIWQAKLLFFLGYGRLNAIYAAKAERFYITRTTLSLGCA